MISQSIEKNRADKVVVERWHNCTGRPAKIHKMQDSGPNFRKKCDYCKKYKTSWYCLECKGWFCMDAHDKTNDYYGLINVCMPVEMTAVEKEEEEEKQRVMKQRNEKRKAKGKSELSVPSNKKRKSSLDHKENFEISCWMKRHSDAWRRKDEAAGENYALGGIDNA